MSQGYEPKTIILKHLHFIVFLFGAFDDINISRQNMKPLNILSAEFSYTTSNKWTHIHSMLVSVSINQFLTFPPWGNHVLKGATIKEKNMLPIGSILFPLRVATMRIKYNFKGQ